MIAANESPSKSSPIGVSGVQPTAVSERLPTEVPAGKVMIVDDEISNVMIAKKHLEKAGFSDFVTTTDSTAAVGLLQQYDPEVLLLDINMPTVSGFDILQQIRHTPSLPNTQVVVLTANTDHNIKLQCLELGASDFLLKPIDPLELVPRVRNSLLISGHRKYLASQNAHLERMVAQRTAELEASRREAIFCLARAAEMRDNDTGNHVLRVGRYAGLIARQLGCPSRFVEDLEVAAQLHDVGKIAIPDAILLKPGKLEPEEFEIIQSHVKLGRQIVQAHSAEDAARMRTHVSAGAEMLHDGGSLMRLAATIAQTHHEKYDGSGYPLGLAGNDIPLEGRIVAVADVFDALSTERPYKKALPREKCFEILQEGRGRHFDPQLLDAFFDASAEIVEVQLTLMDQCEVPTNPQSSS